MPAIHRLRHIAGRCSAAERLAETLTFWTARGVLRIACCVEKVGRPVGATFLVKAQSPESGRHADADAENEAPAEYARGVAPAPYEAANSRGDALLRARLAHELRTPLGAAIAYAEVLKDEHFGPLPDARYVEYARNIHDSVRHALRVAEGMLQGHVDCAGVPQQAFTDVDPSGVVESSLAAVRPLAQRAGIALEVACARGLPRVIADEVSLRQILLNLLANAIKFARRGDRVVVTVEYKDDALRLSVADTGPGMTDATSSTAGHALRPADSQGPRSGLGLGLPLTKALAKANGAALAIETAAGHGTCVTLSFGKDRIVPV
jgi:signal transduction histidine kinase